jgi:Arc/MetJ-type ribon-helix-helix transcriptional regulator
MSDKTRVSVTMTHPYISALDTLVKDGLYLNRGEAILEALRVFLRKEKIEPFFIGNADANTERQVARALS